MDKGDDFSKAYAEMPWMAFKQGDPRIKALKSKFKVKAIPFLAIIDVDTGKTISTRGRKDVQDLQAWPLWKARRERGAFAFDFEQPVSSAVTEEAKMA